MATLQKFKLLATQCAVTGTPTQSPTASPVIHLRRHRHHRRRRTLRMLLSRSTTTTERRPPEEKEEEEGKDPSEKRASRKLKDLFVSSPPFDEENSGRDGGDGEVELLPVTGSVGIGGGVGSAVRRGVVSTTATFRYRLLRRAWRPVLVTIPE